MVKKRVNSDFNRHSPRKMLEAMPSSRAGLLAVAVTSLLVAPSYAFSPVGSVGSAALRASASPFATKSGMRFGLALHSKTRQQSHPAISMTASTTPAQSTGLGWDSHKVRISRICYDFNMALFFQQKCKENGVKGDTSAAHLVDPMTAPIHNGTKFTIFL
jgi:hypothetical protein